MNEEMTISAYDVEVMRQQQKEADRKHGRAIARWKYGSLAVGYVAAAAALVGCLWVLWQAMAGPSASEQANHEQKLACVEAQGTWVILAQGTSGGYGACIFGEVPQP